MTDISKAAVDVAANVLRVTGEHYIASLLTTLRAALDEAEATLKSVLDREAAAYARHDAALAKADAERDALRVERDAVITARDTMGNLWAQEKARAERLEAEVEKLREVERAARKLEGNLGVEGVNVGSLRVDLYRALAAALKGSDHE